jgi:hypothetical protein
MTIYSKGANVYFCSVFDGDARRGYFAEVCPNHFNYVFNVKPVVHIADGNEPGTIPHQGAAYLIAELCLKFDNG